MQAVQPSSRDLILYAGEIISGDVLGRAKRKTEDLLLELWRSDPGREPYALRCTCASPRPARRRPFFHICRRRIAREQWMGTTRLRPNNRGSPDIRGVSRLTRAYQSNEWRRHHCFRTGGHQFGLTCHCLRFNHLFGFTPKVRKISNQSMVASSWSTDGAAHKQIWGGAHHCALTSAPHWSITKWSWPQTTKTVSKVETGRWQSLGMIPLNSHTENSLQAEWVLERGLFWQWLDLQKPPFQ